mmetsp:Transcript_39112/g.93890  ORF Transcript_39112/g.93890 Transcript_39112/m.93890 type:complete len:310 (-) Transcript_39112:323-1252(-)
MRGVAALLLCATGRLTEFAKAFDQILLDNSRHEQNELKYAHVAYKPQNPDVPRLVSGNIMLVFPTLGRTAGGRSRDRLTFQQEQARLLNVSTRVVDAMTPMSHGFDSRCQHGHYGCQEFSTNKYYLAHPPHKMQLNWACSFSFLDTVAACESGDKEWCLVVEDDTDFNFQKDARAASAWLARLQTAVAALPEGWSGLHLCSGDADVQTSVDRLPGVVLGLNGWPKESILEFNKGLVPSAPIALLLRRSHAGEFYRGIDNMMKQTGADQQMDFVLRDLYMGKLMKPHSLKMFHAGHPQLCLHGDFGTTRN